MNVSKNLQNQFVKKYSKNYLKLTENVRNEDKWDSVGKKRSLTEVRLENSHQKQLFPFWKQLNQELSQVHSQKNLSPP
jgi:hypothetical protein